MEKERIYVTIELEEDGFTLSGNINKDVLGVVFDMVLDGLNQEQKEIELESDEIGELH